MAYSSFNDLLNRLSETEIKELTDDVNSGAVENAVIARAIADADAVIDSFCMSRYTVPFSPVPDIIRSISVDISIFNLFKRRGLNLNTTGEAKNNAFEFLREIAAGRITLGIATPEVAARPSCTKSASDRIFTADSIKGY